MPFAYLPGASSSPSRHHRFLSQLFSSTYKSLFPQLLSFLICTKPPGCRGLSFEFFLRTFRTFRLSRHSRRSLVFSCISRLFGSVAKLNSFLFNRIHTLFAKHRGWVVPPSV